MGTARVFQINLSTGGVPKYPVDQAVVTRDGIEGDGHNDLKNHGGPDRALSLFSLERIHQLQEEGHPIFPGATGENLTLAGLPWDRLQPGAVLRLGETVRIEITSFTSPCQKIRAAFSDGDIRRTSQAENPGWSRLYARVLSAGRLRTGDVVSWECSSGVPE